jgi:hypothetical protein
MRGSVRGFVHTSISRKYADSFLDVVGGKFCVIKIVNLGFVRLDLVSLYRVRLVIGRISELRKLSISSVMYVYVCLSVAPPAWNNLAPTERIFIKFDIWIFSENLSR